MFENAIEGKKKFLQRYFSGILPCFKSFTAVFSKSQNTHIQQPLPMAVFLQKGKEENVRWVIGKSRHWGQYQNSNKNIIFYTK